MKAFVYKNQQKDWLPLVTNLFVGFCTNAYLIPLSCETFFRALIVARLNIKSRVKHFFAQP